MLSLLFLICAILASGAGTGAALYIAWCARKAREHAKAGVEWWKLGASSRSLEYELYEAPAHLWINRAQKAQSIIPLAFFLALVFYVLSLSQR
jgi:urease accessory protein UreF